MDFLADERIVLESIFSPEEIEFTSTTLGKFTSQLLKIKMPFDDSMNLLLRIGPGYPESAAEVSVSVSVSVQDRYSLSGKLTALGQQVSQQCAIKNEVAAFAVYTAIVEAYKNYLREPCIENCSQSAAPFPQVEEKKTEATIRTPTSSSCTRNGVSLKFLLRFAADNKLHGFQKWDSHETAESTGSVCFRCVVPKTRDNASDYISLPPPLINQGEVGPATYFVSHAWRASFASMVTALVGNQLGHEATWNMLEAGPVDVNRLITRLQTYLSQKSDPPPTEHFYWIDIFCKNQHIIESEATAAELASTVTATREMLLVLHPLDDPYMLSRVWCLFEISQALTLGAKITGLASTASMLELNDIILRERSSNASRFHNKGQAPQNGKKKGKGRNTSVAGSNAGSLPNESFTGALRRVLDALELARHEATSNINIRTAQATVALDREVILGMIEDSVGIEAMNQSTRVVVEECMRAWQSSALGSWANGKRSQRWEAAAALLRNSSES
jgi:hypothetical protein